MSDQLPLFGLAGHEGPDAALFADPLYLLILGYVIGQPLVKKVCESTGTYAKHKQIFWQPLMVTYNVVMVLFSFTSFLAMVVAVAQTGVYTLGHFDNPLYVTAAKYFYLSKYVEFLDTLFLVVAGKPVSWLQFIHHMGAPLDMGLWYHHKVEGAWIFVLFNGFIHTVMYSYYACTLMKIRFPFKKYITSLQIVQFLSGFTVVFPYCYIDAWWAAPAKRFAWYFNYVYVGTVLALFLNFFVREYVLKPKPAGTQKKE